MQGVKDLKNVGRSRMRFEILVAMQMKLSFGTRMMLVVNELRCMKSSPLVETS